MRSVNSRKSESVSPSDSESESVDGSVEHKSQSISLGLQPFIESIE